ncbi:hypothetical protein [Macrococcoides caseolyticum]|uniref:hypothetical protein n=1 Tax=Macrococcoides caseolyticum TaxID=69966 RepID=UPI001F45C235|nr:hypothetical protein [Macrococcus caseolyticus]MCE4956950.1 hypothetical protein [Macrococcus caseolyticus]
MKQYRDIAFKIALEAHKNQKDKAGNDFINHPITVAEIIERDLYNQVKNIALKQNRVINELLDILISVAYLHDIIEDTSLTYEHLEERGIPSDIIDVIKNLTRDNKSITYFDYIKKISQYPIATVVKLADLQHNLNIDRFKNPVDINQSLLIRYKKAQKILNESLKD